MYWYDSSSALINNYSVLLGISKTKRNPINISEHIKIHKQPCWLTLKAYYKIMRFIIVAVYVMLITLPVFQLVQSMYRNKRHRRGTSNKKNIPFTFCWVWKPAFLLSFRIKLAELSLTEHRWITYSPSPGLDCGPVRMQRRDNSHLLPQACFNPSSPLWMRHSQSHSSCALWLLSETTSPTVAFSRVHGPFPL